MEMIERYLQAVRFWLPGQQKDDIITELSADIYAEVEERESSLGHKLTQAEVESLLKQRGRPVLVASRYQPQRQLIGPLLFPVYVFVLKVVAACYLVPWLAVALYVMFFSPEWRAQHMGHAWSNVLFSTWNGLWSAAFFAFGVITLVFAALEYTQSRAKFLDDWSPAKLPPVRNLRRIPRSGSTVELIVNQIFLLWWADNFHTQSVALGSSLHMSFTALWPYFYWGYLLLALANAVFAVVNLARPYWTVPRAIWRLLFDATGATLFCWLMSARIFTEFRIGNVAITEAVNRWLATFFPVALIVSAVVIGVGVWRVLRVRALAESPAH